MRNLAHDPEIPEGWKVHRGDKVIEELIGDIVRFMPEEDREVAGLPDDPADVDSDERWITAINQVGETVVHLVGARKDPRSERVSRYHIGGYVLAYGHWHGAEVAVLVQWRTDSADDYRSVIDPRRDLFLFVHLDHNPQLVASVRGE